MPTLLFVHGAGGNHESWPVEWREGEETAVFHPSQWRQQYSWLFLDLPGHGRSAPPGRDNIDDYATIIQQVVQVAELTNVILVGHSMGGAIAQTVALTSPPWLQGVILIGTGASMTVSPQLLNGLQDDFAKTADFIANYSWSLSAPPSFKQQTQKHLFQAGQQTVYHDFLACSRFNVASSLAQITAPTLIICGEQDKMMPHQKSQELAATIPDAQLAIIPAAGHYPMNEYPQLVGDYIEQFLQKRKGRKKNGG